MKYKFFLWVLIFQSVMNTGVHARYYDPVNGRFISPDSIVPSASDPQTLNRYAYVRNNPTNLTDPTGNIFWAPIIIGAAMGAAIGGTHGRVFDSKAWERFDWQYAAQGAALGAAGGAAFGLGTFSVGQFVVPGSYMAASVAIAGAGYVVDAYGGNVDTTGYSPSDSYQADYRASRPIHPVRQYYPSANELYAAVGMPDTGIARPAFPLWGLDPQLQVRVRTKDRSDEADNGTDLYHYGYAKHFTSLRRGLKWGGHATQDFHGTGRAAQLSLAIPIHEPDDAPPNARYLFNVDLANTPNVYNPRVAPLLDSHGSVIRPGGGTEYMFPFGTGRDTFRGMDRIPPY